MDTAELEWIAWTNPITTAFGAEVAASDLSGRTVACHQHITARTICIVGPLLQAGARVRMAPCNPDSTDDRAATHLASMGVEIRGHAGMSAVQHADALAWLASEPADALCDMGGELIVTTAAAGHRPAGALEATTTGLHRLAGLDIPFPVLDWNGIALKDLIHNRHHVGAETWPAFTAITGLSLYGREIVVVGFGPVGQGVALRARDLGANVTVVDLDPVRLIQAQHHGCRVADFDDAVRRASVIVTATGFDGVVGAAQIERLPDGAILMNVGHSHREIDVDWLNQHPHTDLRRHLERYRGERPARASAQPGQPREPGGRSGHESTATVRPLRGDHAARSRRDPQGPYRRPTRGCAAVPRPARNQSRSSPGRQHLRLR